MAVPLLELEGTWEEIKERIPDFAGQKLRMLVFPAAESLAADEAAKPIHEMRAEGISDVLTNDHHFHQEGFNVLIHR